MSFVSLITLTGDQVVEIIRGAPAIIAALASLVLAIKAGRDARSAQRSAAAAHERATEAAREQLTFALKRAVRDAKSQGVILTASSEFPVDLPTEEVGAK
jgi:hypothetical protein